MIKDLQTEWKQKRDDPCFEMYRDALQDALKKLMKYYSKLDKKPAYILAFGPLLDLTHIHS